MLATKTALSASVHRLMAVLARLRFATRDQLHHWSKLADLSSITRMTNALAQDGFLEVISDLRPSVYRLSRAGCRVVGARYTARRFSIPVIQHLCHRNSAEILLRSEHPLATFQPRTFALRFGLFPSHAEHCVLVDRQRQALALVDDYGMRSERIVSSWTRQHTPDPRFFTVTNKATVLRWSSIAEQLFVFCTDAVVAERHRQFTQALRLPLSIYEIKPLWRVR